MSVRRSVCVVLSLIAFVLAAPGHALEDVRASLSGIPWLQRVVRDGISLQVDLESLARRGDGAFREKDRVAVRLRISDVNTGLPLDGLDPVAWLGAAPAGGGMDPERCPAEAQEVAAEGTPESLRETSQPGTYETIARLGRPGRYELVFFVGTPRLIHCFQVEVQPRG
ncbi:MAG TPA: hypothetical protein VEW48_11810 [Thermoanaerobaculia bacterium]|nr:hypothetical protein [Thermoanaerobaculia bacterium]